jgi:hypothetical protein
MSKRITTVTHPDGTTSTRSSASATYTHAVVVGPLIPEVAAAYQTARAARLRESADILDAAADAGRVTIRDRRIGGNYGPDWAHAAEAYLMGSKTPANGGYLMNVRCTLDGRTTDYDAADRALVPVVPVVIASARDEAVRLRVVADECDERAARYAAGLDLGGYGVARWSSRRDLAVKAVAGEFAGRVAAGHAVTVVEVDVKA